jgi:hypothetical protein
MSLKEVYLVSTLTPQVVAARHDGFENDSHEGAQDGEQQKQNAAQLRDFRRFEVQVHAVEIKATEVPV